MALFILAKTFLLLISIHSISGSTTNLTVTLPANSSIIWTNNNSSTPAIEFKDGSIARLLMHYPGVMQPKQPQRRTLGYACGFFCCSEWGDLCQFAILLLEFSFPFNFSPERPQVVWSADRENYVGENATLELSQDSLVLKGDNGVVVWSVNSQNLAGMKLDAGPSLTLFDVTNRVVWRSFEHPTSTLLSGQQLFAGNRLTSSPAPPGTTVGLFSLAITHNVVTVSANADVSIPYLVLGDFSNASVPSDSLEYVSFEKGRFTFTFRVGPADGGFSIDLDETRWLPPAEFMRLDPDGALRIYSWGWQQGWMVIYDFMDRRDPCLTPLRCGYFGVCNRGRCSCPRAADGTNYFYPIEGEPPQMGCTNVGLKVIEEDYEMVDFGNLYYFAYSDQQAAAHGIQKLDDCKRACLGNASCMALFFAYTNDASDGLCYMPSKVLSIRGEATSQTTNPSSAYLKVRVRTSASPPSLAPLASLSPPRKAKLGKIAVLVVVLVVVPIVLVLALIIAVAMWRRRFAVSNEHVMERVPGMPAKFSYKELSAATGDFSHKIGRGGFGTVFRGVLMDGRPVAVKRLDSDGQGMDEFVAEVKTIGSIHHINLVQLMGFCAEKSHRLLVYEYMSNGSLDTWIFGSKSRDLDWRTKLKIITDMAKGLAYLHEECRQRIAHLDVKPHNVLLDDKMNAKISDFGLARVIDRDRSQITTTLRGTLGYLAPEWQASEHITVKADIYSFGIVLLEILCGRKNLDYNQHDSRIRLLSLLRRKVDEDKLIDIVHHPVAEMHCHEQGEEALKLVRIGLWCLNDDYKKRPSMSTVVKVLEGAVDLDSQIISYEVSRAMVPSPNDGATVSSS